MWKEFKEFAMKGNVMDMAIGVVIGGAFGKIVSALVEGIIMPIIGSITAGTDFSTLKIVLSPEVLSETGEVITAESAIMYGAFLQTIIDFLIVAFSIFMCVRLINKARAKKKEEEVVEEPAPAGPTTEELLSEIRDYLKELDRN